MKLAILFTLIQLTFICVGQPVEKKLSDEACKCFTLTHSTSDEAQFMDAFLEKCFKSIFFKYEEEILQAFDIKDTTEYSLGYALGQKLAPKMFVYMIHDCDKFYYFFDSLRWSARSSIDRQKAEEDLQKAKNEVKMDSKDAMAYFARGFANFQLDKYKKAIKDFEKSIKLNDTFGPAYLFLGWIKEIKGDYAGAKSDYQRSFDLVGKEELLMLVAIAERKERERNLSRRKQ